MWVLFAAIMAFLTVQVLEVVSNSNPGIVCSWMGQLMRAQEQGHCQLKNDNKVGLLAVQVLEVVSNSNPGTVHSWMGQLMRAQEQGHCQLKNDNKVGLLASFSFITLFLCFQTDFHAAMVLFKVGKSGGSTMYPSFAIRMYGISIGIKNRFLNNLSATCK